MAWLTPRRTVLLVGLVVFVLGTAGSALLPSYAAVLVSRVVAGAGGGMIVPTAGGHRRGSRAGEAARPSSWPASPPPRRWAHRSVPPWPPSPTGASPWSRSPSSA
nr:hypothetical protein [uncultured Actinoplanes sp.]